jgi:hypothetical protein
MSTAALLLDITTASLSAEHIMGVVIPKITLEQKRAGG